MVKKFGWPGYTKIEYEYTCDCCGRRCDPEGTRTERLYKWDGDQLCFECYWEATEPETVE